MANIVRSIRSLARNWLLTSNTLRYRVEYRCVVECFKRAETKCGDLLDAGAGSGEMSLALRRAGFCKTLTAIEPDEANFRILKENVDGVPGCAAVAAALENLPFPDASFDAVLSTQVFEHIDDDHAAAREIRRLLRPEGFVVISVPHPPEFIPNPGHVRPGYTEGELRALFEPLGLAHRHSEFFLTLPTQLRIIAAQQMPWGGIYFPIGWADRERDLANEQRKKMQPYGIACLFVPH